MKEELGGSVKRTGRMAIDVLIAGLMVSVTGDEKWLALAPALAGVAKFMRSMFGWTWLPF